jgi:hypothetical protein
MPIIVNTLPNASTNVNGIEFARHESGHMHSVQPVECSMLDIFLAIPGFKILEQEPAAPNVSEALQQLASAPLSITGTVSEGGAMNLNIPLPDGSTVNLQATGPADAAPVVQGDSGQAAQLAEQFAGAQAATSTEGAQEQADQAASEQPGDDQAAAGKPARKATTKK